MDAFGEVGLWTGMGVYAREDRSGVLHVILWPSALYWMAFNWLWGGRYAIGSVGNFLCPYRSRREHTLLISVFSFLLQL